MNLRSFAALLATALPLVAFAQQSLVVDDAHSQIGVPKGATALVYTLKPGAQLQLDASKYKLKAPSAGATANSVQVIVAKGQEYSVPWDATHQTAALSAATARPNGASKPFTGFVAGQTLVIAIGQVSGANFNVMWVGMAEVK